MSILNQVDWAGIERDFAEGWRHQCRGGYFDSGNCRDEKGERRSFEFREGYEAAERRSGTEADAARAAADHRRTAEMGAYDTYCAVAD